MKKALLIVFITLILAAIPLTVLLVKQQQDIRQKAVPATTIYLDPATVTQNIGEEFTLSVMINTAENLVSAAELHVTFDATYLEAVSIQNGTFLPNVLVSGEVGAGTASITLGSQPNVPAQGMGTLAVLTFRALADTPTPTQVSFSDTTQIAAVDEGATDVLVGSQPAVVTIGALAASPSPSPSTGASPTPGVSPSPAASPSPSPSASVSPSPTPSGAQVTQITTPTNGATTTNRRPTISGTSFANGLMILSTNPVSFSAQTFYASAGGNWTYTPTADMALGAYTITVTGEDSSGTLETDTSTLTISSSTTGGTAIASPTPTPTSSTSVTGASPAASATTTSTVPVTGSTTPTLFLVGLAFIFLMLGLGSFAFSKRES